MKKLIILILIALIGIESANAQVTSQAISNSCGLATSCGSLIASIGTGSAVLANNTYVKARNAADSANVDIFKLDASNNLEINSATGQQIEFTNNGTRVSFLTSTGQIRTDGAQNWFIGSDAAARVAFVSADTNGNASAYANLNSDTGNGGSAQVSTGATGTADLNLMASDDVIIETRAGADVWNFDTATGTFIGSGTATIGWAVVAGANTACTTTCVTPCVFGVDTASATADIVACADATADECLCAGAS